MSVLINGIGMPTKCEECPCYYYEYRECNAISSKKVDGKAEPPEDCPLAEMPDANSDKWVRLAYSTGFKHGYNTGWRSASAIIAGVEDINVITPEEGAEQEKEVQK